jgi:hypothetical protein
MSEPGYLDLLPQDVENLRQYFDPRRIPVNG